MRRAIVFGAGLIAALLPLGVLGAQSAPAPAQCLHVAINVSRAQQNGIKSRIDALKNLAESAFDAPKTLFGAGNCVRLNANRLAAVGPSSFRISYTIEWAEVGVNEHSDQFQFNGVLSSSALSGPDAIIVAIVAIESGKYLAPDIAQRKRSICRTDVGNQNELDRMLDTVCRARWNVTRPS